MLTRRAVTAKAAIAASTTVVSMKRRERGLSSGIFSPQCGRRQRSGSFQVADGVMAAGAFNSFCPPVNVFRVDRLNDVLMAVAAGVLRHLAIELRNLDVVRVAAGGEIKRMKESVHGLHRVFAG